LSKILIVPRETKTSIAMTDKDISKQSLLFLYLGIGVFCYGIAGFGFMYLLINSKWSYVSYFLILFSLAAFTVVIYSIVKSIKIIRHLTKTKRA
jgi:hypothetical protein